ncbi:MAG TPA: carboxypeptidase-like regulatory domain-containing protein, partial [Chitinophagaceae bacterium]|nr:carboxypeptidase-like regulatory domain-containing protein [Chitinophagaceae bacterium]
MNALQRKLLLILLFFCSLPQIFAQERTITGKVLSGEGNTPLGGVTIIVKGSNRSTLTDASGNFTIAARNTDVLQFTYVGFAPYEVRVGETTNLSITLQTQQGQLGEVVVTAYGINRNRKSLGYSTPTVQGDEVSQTQRENFIQGLAGRVPGLSVNATSGNPGASQQIVLRGIVSLEGDNSPLIVVDGLPIDNSIFHQSAMVSSGTNRNNDYSNRSLDINPADIESYTILKGPEATALYGNLGASGAIVITTKKAKAGRGSVTYNNSFRWEQQTRFPEVQQVYSQGVSNGVYSGATRNYFGPKYADSLQ